MNGKKAKQLRRLAASIRANGPVEDIFLKKDGSRLHSGQSIVGTYEELKERYKKLSREGKEPWKKLNQGKMF